MMGSMSNLIGDLVGLALTETVCLLALVWVALGFLLIGIDALIVALGGERHESLP